MPSAELPLALAPDAEHLLFALVELGHLDDRALDELSASLRGVEGPVDAARLRREVAALLFEHPPGDREQARLLDEEWALLFG